MEKTVLKIKSCIRVNSELAGFFIIKNDEHVFYEKSDLIEFINSNNIELETISGKKVHVVNNEFIRTNPDNSTTNDLNDLPHINLSEELFLQMFT